jgi:cytochrome b
MNDSQRTSLLVWDAPVRVFHWLIALSFVGAFVTADSERWRFEHVTLGYTMLGLVAFRLVWGLIGTRYARFAAFVRGPRAVAAYVGALLRGQPEHHLGHNPAGALAIVALLALTCITALTGWATYDDLGGHWLEELHEGAANTLLLVVGIHVVGVLAASWLHRENLLRAMVTGYKLGAAKDAIARAWATVAVLLLLGVPAFWLLQWHGAGHDSVAAVASSTSARHHERDHD